MQVHPRRAQKQVPKRCLSSTSDRDGRRGCPRGPGDRGGHGPSRFLWRLPLHRMEPPSLCPETPLPAGRGPRGHTPKSGNSDPACFQNRLHPCTSPGAIEWTLGGAGWKCSTCVTEVLHFFKNGTVKDFVHSVPSHLPSCPFQAPCRIHDQVHNKPTTEQEVSDLQVQPSLAVWPDACMHDAW